MITSLRLQNFRSYKDSSFEFEPGVNIIVGPNGSGKTNLLEALLVMATGSSYRTGDQELIKLGENWARIDASFDVNTRSIKLQQTDSKISKSYIFDDKPYKILTHQHILPVVLFQPEHLMLLHGQPENRRLYLDNLLERTMPGFSLRRKQYRRALSQRNALLKQVKRPSSDQLFVWNLRLSELGGAIAAARIELIDNISKKLADLYSSIAGSSATRVGINYASKLPVERYESVLLSTLEKNIEKDIVRGFTGAGPHRDDFVIDFDGNPAAEVASRGETRTALLALKIFELNMMEQIFEQKPFLLLDDVFSELDGKRRHALASFIKTHQTFITTTDADLVIDKKMQSNHIIPLTND